MISCNYTLAILYFAIKRRVGPSRWVILSKSGMKHCANDTKYEILMPLICQLSPIALIINNQYLNSRNTTRGSGLILAINHAVSYPQTLLCAIKLYGLITFRVFHKLWSRKNFKSDCRTSDFRLLKKLKMGLILLRSLRGELLR